MPRRGSHDSLPTEPARPAAETPDAASERQETIPSEDDTDIAPARQERPPDVFRGGGATIEKARVKGKNEDAVLEVRSTLGDDKRIRAIGVLDGASTGGKGAHASELALSEISSAINAFPAETRTDAAAAEAALRTAFMNTQNKFENFRQVLDHQGETTAAIILPIEDPTTGHPTEVVIGAIGDSPVFRIRGGALEQLTNDQTQAEEEIRSQIAKGTLPEAALHYLRGNSEAGTELSADDRGIVDTTRNFFGNVIRGGFGVKDSLPPQVRRESAQPGDLFFAASDGLTKLLEKGSLTPADIQAFADAHPDDGAAFAKALIDRVRELGPLDDTSVAAFRVAETPPRETLERSDTQEPASARAETKAVPTVEPLIATKALGQRRSQDIARRSPEELQELLAEHLENLRAAERQQSYELTGWLAERIGDATPPERRRAVVEQDRQLREEAVALIESRLLEVRAPKLAQEIRTLKTAGPEGLEELGELAAELAAQTEQWTSLIDHPAELNAALADDHQIELITAKLGDYAGMEKRFTTARSLLARDPERGKQMIREILTADRGFKDAARRTIDRIGSEQASA